GEAGQDGGSATGNGGADPGPYQRDRTGASAGRSGRYRRTRQAAGGEQGGCAHRGSPESCQCSQHERAGEKSCTHYQCPGQQFATQSTSPVCGKSHAMSPSRLFILRPVATSLLMIGLLLVGIVAYRQLPVSALPQVDYPTIQVTTFYPGAGPDVMASSVTAPMERQFGQVPGLSQMTSTSSYGRSVIPLQFNLALTMYIADHEVLA